MHYQLTQLVQQYGSKIVLHIDNLVIEKGKIYALLGANGAGKTTLFHILGFLEAPSSGQVVFDGKTVFFDRAELYTLRKRVVMVDQYPIMFSTSVYKNVEFGLKIRGIEKKRRDSVIREALEMVDLGSYAGEYAHKLSGGETQRLAMARALALFPEVLLCDEPTANVDVENQAVIRSLLTRVNQEKNTTVLFTTHDRLQAAGLADETIVLEKGRVVATSYENIFSCTLQSKGSGKKVCLLQQKVPVTFPGHIPEGVKKESRVYINPERIKLTRNEDGAQPKPGVLSGTIVLLMVEGQKVRIAVNTGVLITVIIPLQRYREQRLAVGDRVELRLLADTIEWLGE
ncbi:MAG: hypothetical protein CSB34_02985 [Desulfobulbus propionicus]|nr:MAG: hypothetical protein CSB34_02985 [Desulfobulbus propionicus]